MGWKRGSVRYRSDTPAYAAEAFARAAEPQPGVTLGPYTLARRIGKGGQGSVWLAHRYTEAGDETVAIKIGRADAIATEAHALRAAKSRHVVRLLASCALDDVPHLVLEHIEGQTLAELSHAHGPIPPSLASRIVRDAAKGLRSIHAAGLVHRDIKPANIMLARDGRVVLIDLGHAQPQGPQAAVAGTHTSMAPCQAEGGHVGPAEDEHGLAVVYAQLVQGAHPYRQAGRYQTLAAATAWKPQPQPPPCARELLQALASARV